MTTVASLLLDAPGGNLVDQLRNGLDTHASKLALRTFNVPHLTHLAALEASGYLEIPLVDILRRAWTEHKEVRKARERTAKEQGRQATVTVLRHTLRVDHRFHVQLQHNAGAQPLFDLTLGLVLLVDALTLVVRDGKVTGVGAHTISAGAEIGAARPGGKPFPLLRKTTAVSVT
jgi:hypothetical protein